jgi:hypothetical protein
MVERDEWIPWNLLNAPLPGQTASYCAETACTCCAGDSYLSIHSYRHGPK